ncbi:uncharacterized protein LOC126377005 [Pectinophora gossypiella]|uniref:uncharacterized protein LOC126377005 n=1 Tax=Pectinophora gossypiella TaxID=13191 RepID=UPI00214DFC96|nr:uncharacterized protein LOC126377005 [Pectinophora gossypiella]
MKQDPCSVCGGTDMNLIDGFYYCVECGTQDVNAQETIVEHTVLADGTFAHAATRKFTTVLKDAVEMSEEWHKWHAFNFILAGLVDELTDLGAPPGFRMKVMWIWTRYIKAYQDKEKMGMLASADKEEVKKSKLFIFEDEVEEESAAESEEDIEKNIVSKRKRRNARTKKESVARAKASVKVVTKGLLLAILYLALNFCQSQIQLSHILRFVRERRLSIVHCTRFVPKELNVKSIPHWRNFVNCREYTSKGILQIAMSLIKSLKLGPPLVPDLRKIVDNLVTDLCLPKEFKNLVYSLMHYIPCDFLAVDYKFANRALVRVPDFEGVVMAYILIALKMTFGLDDQYEITLSNAVEQINDEENRLKSHKLGLYSQPTDRLFSFREWCNFLQFRKKMLCKYYLPMAQQHNLDIDDRVFMEQLGSRRKRKDELSDEVIMDILNKLPWRDDGKAIPISEFTATLTPMSNYTDVILQYVLDTDLKLLLSEDFTQYSLKYTCQDLMLVINEKNLITGVSEENKTINRMIIGTLVAKEGDYSMVFVRNCDNKNWLKTRQPTKDHVIKTDEHESSDKDNDPGYDSNNTETSPIEKEVVVTNEDSDDDDTPERKLETIEEEAEGTSIFDDPFDDINEDKKSTIEELDNDGDVSDQFNNASINLDNLVKSFTGESSFIPAKFNPETFDREQTIKECILMACKKYRIPVPKDPNPRKRRNPFIRGEAGVSDAKRTRVDRTSNVKEGKIETDRIMSAYYANLQKDLLDKVSEHVKSFVQEYQDNFNIDDTLNKTCDLSSIHNDSQIKDEVMDNEAACEDKSLVEIDSTDKQVDSSIMEGNSDEENIPDDPLRKESNPEFDEKTHDTKQLYVKYDEDFVFDGILDIEDPEIDKIIAKKIEECKFNEPVIHCPKDLTPEEDKSDSDDSEEESLLEYKNKQDDKYFEPLIEESTEIKKFSYWTRHYASAMMRRNADLKLKFDLEIKQNCPKSFNFVIQECAAILDCTAFSLYKHIQFLEQQLLNRAVKLK